MKRKETPLSVLAVVLVGVIDWQVAQPSETEPLYKGKPLSFYLQAYMRDPGLSKGVPTHQEADEALRQAGTNATPALLRMIRPTDSPLKLKLISLARTQHILLIRPRPAYFSNFAAMEVFHMLGPKGTFVSVLTIDTFDRRWSTGSDRRFAQNGGRTNCLHRSVR